MEFINIIASTIVIFLALIIKIKPNLIAGFKHLPEEKKEKFPINFLFYGLLFIAIINVPISIFIQHSKFKSFSQWTFLFVITIGVVILQWLVNEKLK